MADGVTIRFGLADGSLAAPVQVGAGVTGHAVRVVDLDFDGIADLLVGEGAGDFRTFAVLLGGKNRTFQAVQRHGTVGIVAFALDDVDGDGALDLIGARPSPALSDLVVFRHR